MRRRGAAGVAMRVTIVAALLALAFALAGCETPEGDPGANGRVTSYERLPNRGLVLFVDGAELGEGFPSASVAVTGDTRVLMDDGGSFYVPSSIDEIREGDIVEVWFDGPVRESFPVQGTAGTLLIRGEAR